MKYQCNASDCKKTFIHAAKITEHRAKELTVQFSTVTPQPEENDFVETETFVCPYCRSLNFSEFVEPTIADAKVSAVLVVDLVSGENLALNKALADGYEITARYAKQFILEKKVEVAKA